MNLDYPGAGRNTAICVACGSSQVIGEWSITSSFFAQRALLSTPQVIAFRQCRRCGTRYFDFGATDEQLSRLYDEYRGEAYFELRHGLEPWYTREINDGMGGEGEMTKRRAILMKALADACIVNNFRSALDHGGDRGQMLRDVMADRKAVYEISGVKPDPGVEAVNEQSMRSTSWDLVLSCHVIEHLTNPGTYVSDLVALGRAGATYFIEVPNETVRASAFSATDLQRRWLAWLCKRPGLLKLFDFLSTGMLARTGFLPPLLFFPLREHLTFFTVKGITSLLENNGLSVHYAKVLASGHIGVVGCKR